MDERRIQAYVELIQQLLGCAQGEEGALLQANAGLVDAELVTVMGQVADWMESQGNSNAGWLRQVAAGVVQALGVGAGSPASAASGDAARFLVEIVQLIAQTQGNRAKVYEFFRANVRRLDEVLLRVLPDVFVMLVQQIDPSAVAAVFVMLGNLIQQFPLGNRMLNLEMGIVAYEQALQAYTRDAFPEQWAGMQNNLAAAYNKRIRGERADNLERAIKAAEQALQVYTRDAFPKQWAMTQNNLAAAYNKRIRGERADNLEQAIKAYQQALKVYTRDAFPEQWAGTQNNLARAYSNRIRGESADNLEQAIKAYQQALQIYTRDAFPEQWAGTQTNLANAYNKRIRGEQADNSEWAIKAYRQVLQVYTRDAFPEQWAGTQTNLANAYLSRIYGEHADNLERAIKAYEQALQIRTRDAFPTECRDTAQNLGNLHFQEKSWAAAVDAYRIAIAAVETLYLSSISYAGKGDELKAAANIPRNLAYAEAQLVHHQAAVLTLEQSCARGLSESLNRDRANLDQLQQQNPTLYKQYQTIITELRNLESQDRDRMVSADLDRITPEVFRNEATRLRGELDATIAQIRQVHGYADFLTPTKWEDIEIALRTDNPLIYIVPTSHGGIVLMVTVGEIEILWLNDLTPEVLQKLLVGSGDIENLNGGWFVDYLQAATDRQAWDDTIATTTRQLWDLLMGPISQKLQTMGYDRTTLVPTGLLSLLPLHAAWTEDESKPTGRRYALDDLHITYAPNAKSLIAAQGIVKTLSDRGQTDTILAIDEPHHRVLDRETSQYKPVSPLPSASKEVENAIATFQNPCILRHDQATRAAVLDALPHTTILHCSCHGNANLQEPLKSGLAMTGDGEAATLTLKDIFALNLAESGGLRLAILSACETGIQGIENADEAISLPTGLLQAGVAAVIASLWSVDDLSTMMLLARFYDLWRKDGLRKDGAEPAEALRQAQQWVRDTTSQQKAQYFKETNPDIFQALILLPSNYFAHPFHWAAFSYVGA
jgi:CHAT domain-containing protein